MTELEAAYKEPTDGKALLGSARLLKQRSTYTRRSD